MTCRFNTIPSSITAILIKRWVELDSKTVDGKTMTNENWRTARDLTYARCAYGKSELLEG